MSHPVKLSEELVSDARETARLAERSIARQVEYWAQLGRAIEPRVDGARAMALRQSGERVRLSASLASVDSPNGRQRVAEYLQTRPFPHYEAANDRSGLLVRVDEDGNRTLGQFVGRSFLPSYVGQAPACLH